MTRWSVLLLSLGAAGCSVGSIEDASVKKPSEPPQPITTPVLLAVGDDGKPKPSDPSGRPARAVPGGAVLDAFGGIHAFGAFALDTTGAAYWKDWDIARALVVLPDGTGGWTLDGWGAVHAFGKAPPISGGPYWSGDDRARALVVLPDHQSGYVLEATGAVHEFGSSAPALAGAPTFDKDIARGLEIHLDADGRPDGGWVLDGYGGTHAFGKAPASDAVPYYPGYDFWLRLHKVEGGFWAIGKFGVIQPVGLPAGVALDGIVDWDAWDVVRDVVPVGATKPTPFDRSRSLRCPEAAHDYCGFEGGIRGVKLLSFHCGAADAPPESVKLCWYGCAAGVCADPPPPPPPVGLKCENVQWWNTALTYSSKPTWWDTDLAVGGSTPVVLRHDSVLDNTGVYGWGYMPEFTDLATGKRFRFLHLRPSSQWATEIGKTYPAGYVVGLSGGDTYDTGLPKFSTGAHLCVQTIEPYRDVFPSGWDACK